MASMKRFQRLQRDEAGMTYVFIGLGFMAFLSATMLAIDVGMLMTARSQAQNSADAGALAGATALVFDDYDDRSATGPAVTNARGTATLNQVMASNVSVNVADVEFPTDPSGEPNRVRVTVRRTAARGNAVSNLVAAYFGMATTDIGAVATAEASLANAATCVKPWGIPDKWNEVQDPSWDETDSFDIFQRNGQQVTGTPLANPDIYIGPHSDAYTGFRSNRMGPDYGRRIVLKHGNPNQAISASHFYPISLPGGEGGAWYEENIGSCWPGVLQIGDRVPVEPGNMVGPTSQGVDVLIDRDPSASWNAGEQRVDSTLPLSPRIIVIPAFNPQAYEEGRTHGNQHIEVVNLLAFFVERMDGNDVVGRLVPFTGLRRGSNVPSGAFLRNIRLVE
jgi:Flp pilus assembly protein TadG